MGFNRNVVVSGVMVGLSACGVGTAELNDDVRPTDEALASTQQELISCAAQSETGYDRGRPYAITVVTVDGKPVERTTANAYALMQEAAARAGIRLSVVSGFRSMAQQRYLYACYVNCNCNSCNLAAEPGYSNHQSGEALDLNTAASGVYSWLVNNASRYGFYRTVPSEPWHWEFFGPPIGVGPCSGSGGSTQSDVISFENLKPGGWYNNGFWMHVKTSPKVRIVRYSSDGYPLGDSEHAEQRFAIRYTFSNPGDRSIVAKAYDADLKLLGQTEVKVKVVPDEVSKGSMVFESPDDGGWFTNGIWLKTRVTGPIARVQYLAGPYALGESVNAGDLFPVRVDFNTLGWRVVTAIGYDLSGAEVTRKTTTIRVLE